MPAAAASGQFRSAARPSAGGKAAVARAAVPSAALSRASPRAEAFRDAIATLLGSRLIVWGAGVAAVLIFGFGPAHTAYHAPGLTSGFGFLGDVLAAPAARWDGAWYLTIAHSGYMPQLGPFTEARAAFFPLYPLLVSLGSEVGLPGVLGGIIVSLLALLAALYGLHRLMTLELDTPGSRLWGEHRPRSSPRDLARLAVLLTALGPMAFFLSADYSESLFLALSIGAFLQARRGAFASAGVLGGLAAATRSTGVLLLVPIAIIYLYGPREDIRPCAPSQFGGFGTLAGAHGLRASWTKAGQLVAALPRLLRPRYRIEASAGWLLLIPAGLAAYLAWYWLAGGEVLAPFHAQALWGRHFAGPFVAVWDGMKAAFEGARQLISGQSRHLYFPLAGKDVFIEDEHNLMLFVFLALAVPAVTGVLRRLPFAYGAYLLIALALPLSYPVETQPLMSLPRFLLVMFPMFMWLAAYLAPRRRATHALLVICVLSLLFFTGEFSTWHWVA